MGAQLQARMLGWVIVAAVRLGVLWVRGCWWLITRCPLLVAAAVCFQIAHGWQGNPSDRLLVIASAWALVAFGMVQVVANRPRRRRRLREMPGDWLERQDVQRRVVARLPEGPVRSVTAEGLSAWGTTRRRGGRWRDIPGDYLTRADVQAWITQQVHDGHSRAAVAEALRVFHGRHRSSRRSEWRQLRRLARTDQTHNPVPQETTP